MTQQNPQTTFYQNSNHNQTVNINIFVDPNKMTPVMNATTQSAGKSEASGKEKSGKIAQQSVHTGSQTGDNTVTTTE